MATINGTLKYKQDDGSIVELNPVGVDNTARTTANNNADAIGAWTFNNPMSSIATVIGEWDLTHDISGGENITTVLDRVAADLSNEITDRKNADTALDTRVTELERLPSVDFPIIGIFTGTGPNNTITIAVPIPSAVRLLSAKSHYPAFSISGGTIGVVFEYKDPDGTIHSFMLSSVSVSDLGLFVSITGKPSLSLPIEPGTFVWGSYKQAATVTTLHVTYS